MFLRLLWESFRRQRRRKILAGLAILLGTTAVTAMLALATTIGDRIHAELAVYGANIVVSPAAEQLEVKIGGVNVRPDPGTASIKESDLAKLRGIFWANNITGVSPELPLQVTVQTATGAGIEAFAKGLWFHHALTNGTGSPLTTGAPFLHPLWKLDGRWPSDASTSDVVIGSSLAAAKGLHVGDNLSIRGVTASSPQAIQVQVVGVLHAADDMDNQILMPLHLAQALVAKPDTVQRVEVSARTKPEDAFARKDPDTLSPSQKEIWYCRPYANSIAYQIREAIPGARAEQIRRVEQNEGSILSRISGLMWFISAAAMLASAFAVSAAMTTAILERQGEIGLMRSLGASKAVVASLFYSESVLLAVIAGTFGYLIGSGLANVMGAKIFGPGAPGQTGALIPVLLPVVVALALAVAVAGSTPAIRRALGMDPSAVLRAEV